MLAVRLAVVGAAMAALPIASAGAGSPAGADSRVVSDGAAKSVGERLEDAADTLWDLPELYKNKKNPVVQEVAITGRYQGQWHYTDANTGSDDGWENRRFRLGVAGYFFQGLEFDLNFNLANGHGFEGRFLQDLDSLTFGWKFGKAAELAVGKQTIRISQEWSTSSKRLLTFERSLLVNQIIPAKLWGAKLEGEWERVVWEGGAFIGAIDDDWGWPETSAGFLVSASLGYDYSKAFGTEEGIVRLDYVYNNGDPRNSGAEDYRHLLSLNTSQEWKRWGLNTDLIFAAGLEDEPDAFGIVIMPFWDVAKHLRLVARYQFATASSADGIGLASRYERPAVDDGSERSGDDYHAIYGGLIYYLRGDQLKLMSGVEWSTLGGDADFEAWTWLSGIRMYF